MSPELRDRWVAALRSGKYKQGQEVLRCGGHYCCLGVLCDVVDPNGWLGNEYHYGPDREDTELPGALAEELGMTPGGVIDARRSLITLNDAGRPFSAIADLIESGQVQGVPAKEAR